MEDFKRSEENNREKGIVFSRTVKAGKRIYYIDVKRNRKDELYLAFTESKKIVSGAEIANPSITFEKHKIFLYREDFDNFLKSTQEAIAYIEGQQGKSEPRPESNEAEIKIDLDF
ncbi:MAG: DUF3276 family protein [Bacteroidaceae bacterium]|nr:DUF3276 family protein [Bacteroidaceae bacterium]